MKGIFKDRYGYMKDGWAFLIGGLALVALFVVLGVAIAGVCAYAQTQGCHSKLDAYHLDGHYNFWANTCFADLEGGAVNTDNLKQDSKGYTIYTPDLLEGNK